MLRGTGVRLLATAGLNRSLVASLEDSSPSCEGDGLRVLAFLCYRRYALDAHS